MTCNKKILFTKGKPSPLGSSIQGSQVNFALVCECARSVTLHLFKEGKQKSFASFLLSEENKTGAIWHIALNLSLQEPLEYAYEVSPIKEKNPQHTLLIDPYAKGLSTGHTWGETNWFAKKNLLRAKLYPPSPFDWEGIQPPRLALEDVILYEMHVRGFTAHSSSNVAKPGTFAGLIEKIPHLKSLGINAIELMPIFEFNECEINDTNPQTKKTLRNMWGYSTINFFSVMNRYVSQESAIYPLDEVKKLVKEMHRHGIEVYLDVVYNHTAEGGDKGPVFCFKGLDKNFYYLLGAQGEYLNFSGTGNTVNANHPVMARLIVNSLRYWVQEAHIDGFRFDLASCLTRDEKGAPSDHPLLIELISKDPILSSTKLIAEAWDPGGLYQVGSFPGGNRFLEWNGTYRDAVRQFIKGTDGQTGAFTQALTGYPEIYKDKGPLNSINFVCCHDGFTLADLVSYNDKHNEANAEENRDGCNNNNSWNCGAEGETEDEAILQMRKKQMRNFHTALMVSIGMPMLFMGDEYAHTKKGNNNTYCQDGEESCFLWKRLEEDPGWLRFYQKMIHFRKEHPLLKRSTFLTEHDIFWHGKEPLQANWGVENRLVAYTLTHPKIKETLYIAFNTHPEPVTLTLPPSTHSWQLIVDTSKPSPRDFLDKPTSLTKTYTLPEYSTLIAQDLK